MQAGVSAVELQPTISGEPGVGVGLEQGWGGHGELWWHPLQQEHQPPQQPPSCRAFRGAQGTLLMERGSGAQPRGCWAGWCLRAEMLLSGFLSEQEI